MEIQAKGFSLIVAALIRQLSALWRDANFYDGDLVAARAARSATLVESAQGVVRTQTRSYLKYAYQQFEDLDFPTDAEIDAMNDGLLERAVSPLDEWNRPAEQYRYAKSIGKDDREAMEIAVKRVEELADLDMELAMRKQASDIIKATPKVTGYRRVLHPELSETGTSCGLCIAASTRVYKKAELLAIHDHCHCGIMPIVGSEDPGQQFNEDDLKLLYELAQGTDQQALSRVRYKINDHGELGPYLVEQGAKNRSAGKKNPSNTGYSLKESIAAQIASIERSLPRLIERRKAGEAKLDEAINWQQDRLRVLKQQQVDLKKRRK
jgi:hypothetical protein